MYSFKKSNNFFLCIFPSSTMLLYSHWITKQDSEILIENKEDIQS